jgi:copper chaperone CopZ
MKRLTILILTCTANLLDAADHTVTLANATNCFTISGMHCDGCANGLTAELKETPGVVTAQVTFSNKLAVVAIDTNKTSAAQLTKVIKAAGFEGKPLKP